MTVEWSTLSSWAISHVVVRGSALMIALSWLWSTFSGWPLEVDQQPDERIIQADPLTTT